jgi:hypothetical protein
MKKLINMFFRIESDEEPTGDEYLRDLKKQRLKIKDELHSIIKET